MNVTGWMPVWPLAGVQSKRPVEAPSEAPEGSPIALNVSAAPSGSCPVTPELHGLAGHAGAIRERIEHRRLVVAGVALGDGECDVLAVGGGGREGVVEHPESHR